MFKSLISNEIFKLFITSVIFVASVGVQLMYSGNRDYDSNTVTKEQINKKSNDSIIKKPKIVVVSSGNADNFYTRPQIIGFNEFFRYKYASYDYFNCFYIKSLDYTYDTEMKFVFEKIMKTKPQILLIVGNDIFSYVTNSESFLNTGATIIFSGIDYFTYKKFSKYLNTNTFSVIYKPNINKTIKFLKLANVYNVNIIFNRDCNVLKSKTISFYTNKLSSSNFNVVHNRIYSVEELKSILTRNNKTNKQICYFILIDKLYSFELGKSVGYKYIFEIFKKYNKNKLEFSNNLLASKLFNIALAEGVDYYEVGKKAGKIVYSIINNTNMVNKTTEIKSKFVCNFERLEKLGYGKYIEYFYENFDDIF